MSVAEERLAPGECPTPVPDPDVRHWQRWGAKLGITSAKQVDKRYLLGDCARSTAALIVRA